MQNYVRYCNNYITKKKKYRFAKKYLTSKFKSIIN